jgi:hypothetical protein
LAYTRQHIVDLDIFAVQLRLVAQVDGGLLQLAGRQHGLAVLMGDAARQRELLVRRFRLLHRLGQHRLVIRLRQLDLDRGGGKDRFRLVAPGRADHAGRRRPVDGVLRLLQPALRGHRVALLHAQESQAVLAGRLCCQLSCRICAWKNCLDSL